MDHYNLACMLALQYKGNGEIDIKTIINHLADAIVLNHKHAKDIKTDKDLDRIRDQELFKKLLADSQYLNKAYSVRQALSIVKAAVYQGELNDFRNLIHPALGIKLHYANQQASTVKSSDLNTIKKIAKKLEGQVRFKLKRISDVHYSYSGELYKADPNKRGVYQTSERWTLHYEFRKYGRKWYLTEALAEFAAGI